MSAPPNEFEIPGDNGPLKFRVERLKPKVSLAGLRLVSKVLLPALAEAHSAPAGQIGNAITRVVEGLECLPELLDLFSPRTQIPSPANAEAWAQLGPFVDDVFCGHPDLLVQYLAKCVQGEYAGFLAGSGPLAGMLKQAAAKAV